MNRSHLVAALLAACTALAISAPARAETASDTGLKPGKMLLARIDTNGDGKIEASEIEAMRARIFERLDTNGDGQISLDEKAAAEKKIQRAATAFQLYADHRFEMLDTNGDGVVSKDEYAKGGGRFKILDANDDGALEQDELAKLCLLAPKGCN